MSEYVLIANQFDQIVSAPGKPLEYKRYVRGESVKLTDAEAERLIKAGAVAGSDPEPVSAVAPAEPPVAAPAEPVKVEAPAKPNRPKNTAPEEEWFEYAIALGHSREDAEKAGREGLIQSL